MSEKLWPVAKLNLRNIKTSYFITLLFVLLSVSDYVVSFIGIIRNQDLSGDTSTSVAWALWLVIPLAAIFISTRNFERIINLGGKRDNYLLGSFMGYILLSAAVSLICTVFYYALDRPVNNSATLGFFYTPPDTFGWKAYGPVCVFLQQFAFLLLFAAFVHTLSAIQDKWYGWTADVVIVAIISVFTPIRPLRNGERWFFHTILFANPVLQVIACLVLTAIFFVLNKKILARKII